MSADTLCVEDNGDVVSITNSAASSLGNQRRCRKSGSESRPSKVSTPTDNQNMLTSPFESGEFFGAGGNTLLSDDPVLSGPQVSLAELWRRLSAKNVDDNPSPFTVLHFGDSHSRAGTFAQAVRDRLADAPTSPGFLTVGFPWRWHAKVTKSRGWKRHNWLRDESGPFGPLGIAFESTRNDETLSLILDSEARQNRPASVTIFYRGQPTDQPFSLTVDDEELVFTPQNFEIPAPRDTHSAVAESVAFVSVTLTPDQAELVLTTKNVSSSDPLRIYGFHVRYVDAALEWDVLAVDGTTVKHALTKADYFFDAYIRHRKPDLSLIWFGTNSAGHSNYSDAEYEVLYRAYLTRVSKAADNSVCIAVGPTDFVRRDRNCFLSSYERRARRWRNKKKRWVALNKNRRTRTCTPDKLINHRKRGRYRFPVPAVRNMRQWRQHKAQCAFKSPENIERLVAIQKRVAHEHGCLYFNIHSFMGGSGGIVDWVCNEDPPLASLDMIHFTTEGYQKVGNGLVESLNKALKNQ